MWCELLLILLLHAIALHIAYILTINECYYWKIVIESLYYWISKSANAYIAS